MSTTLQTTTFLGVLGAGIVGGVFYAFSSFVMPALERLPAAQGIAAMKEINVTAEHPAFMVAFMGTTVLCLYLGVRGIVDWGDRRATLLVAGSVLYLVGAFLLTVAHNVPLNDDLAGVAPHAADAADALARVPGRVELGQPRARRGEHRRGGGLPGRAAGLSGDVPGGVGRGRAPTSRSAARRPARP